MTRRTHRENKCLFYSNHFLIWTKLFESESYMKEASSINFIGSKRLFWYWNSLFQSCEAKQRICDSENHYMKNHSLHQKVWPSEVMAPDYEFLCLFQMRLFIVSSLNNCKISMFFKDFYKFSVLLPLQPWGWYLS